jgi:hypothetical protein
MQLGLQRRSLRVTSMQRWHQQASLPSLRLADLPLSLLAPSPLPARAASPALAARPRAAARPQPCSASLVPSHERNRLLPAVTLCALCLPPLFSWLGLLLRMPRCQWIQLCSLLGSCVFLCLLSRCRLRHVLLGVAPFRSAPLGVLKPKPPCSSAWYLIGGCLFGPG